MSYPQRLIIGKEKRFVLCDRPADTAAKLVLAKFLFGQLLPAGEVVVAVGVESIIAKEFKQRAVEIVGARLCENVYDAT